MTDPLEQSHSGGYRLEPRGGPSVRTDIVDVYVFREAIAGSIELLLLERASQPLKETWQPVMGHVEQGESALQTAVREVREEVGLDPENPMIWGGWALEQVHPYYVAAIDSIVLSPRFALRVATDWVPTLNAEHTRFKWLHIALDNPQPALGALLWPGQRSAVLEIMSDLLDCDSPTARALAVDWCSRQEP